MLLCVRKGIANVTTMSTITDDVHEGLEVHEGEYIPLKGLEKIVTYDGTVYYYAPTYVVCLNNADEVEVGFTTLEQWQAHGGKLDLDKNNVTPLVSRKTISEIRNPLDVAIDG